MKAYLKIEMPKSCASCEWSKLSKMDLGMSCFCTLVKKIGSLEIAKNNRMDFCPLVPVPPHGRLIDADALIDAIIAKYIRHERNRELVFAAAEIKQDLADIINELPTIIPAEEGE